MGTDDSQKYLVRDPQGNVYGPADVDLLAQWVLQGRIIPGMYIAPRETGEWAEVSTHPALAHLFSPEAAPQQMPPSTPDLEQSPPTTPLESTPAPAVEQPATTPAEPAPSPYATPTPASPVSTYPVTRVGSASPEALPYDSVGLRQNNLAVISLVLGILAIVASPFGAMLPCICLCIPFDLLTAVGAIIFGGIGLAQINREPTLFTGRGQAIAGMVLGIVALLMFVIFLVAGIALNMHAP
jgi:hypothetical protein